VSTVGVKKLTKNLQNSLLKRGVKTRNFTLSEFSLAGFIAQPSAIGER